VLECVGGLSDFNADNVGSKFVDIHREKSGKKDLGPTTIKNYINHIKHFCHFLLSSQKFKNYHKNCKLILERSSRWLASLRKPIARRKEQVKLDSFNQRLTEDDMTNFWRSPNVIRAQELLVHVEDKPQVADFLVVRNYLLGTLVVTNACRSLELCNMTVSDYNRGRSDLTKNGDMLLCMCWTTKPQCHTVVRRWSYTNVI